MPAIFIGVGGIGGSIVAKIRQELDTRVAFAGDTNAAKQRAQDFHFLLVDTDNSRRSHVRSFAPQNRFVIPSGPHAQSVNQRIKALYASDPPFQQWWPATDYGTPQLVGDFDHGAGQFRIKGKLAYRISLELGNRIVAAVKAAQEDIQGVLLPGDPLPYIDVYIASSLGGGTGSGISLVLAQHLKEALPGNCRLIGVFPLASVTKLKPQTDDHTSIWANTDAALREIDYCQRVDKNRQHALTPFLAWGTQSIQGQQPPFRYVYLFGRSNSNGETLKRIDQYISLIAESMVLESFSNLTDDEAIASHINEPHSQFNQHLEDHPYRADRTTRYASAAVASLVYPAERIERHLGRRYAMAVFDRLLTFDKSAVTTHHDSFVQQESLIWDGAPSLVPRLEDHLEMANGQLAPLPRFRKLMAQDDERYRASNQRQVGPFVNQARQELASFVSERLQPHLDARRTVVVKDYCHPDRGIRRFVRQMLIDGGPGALGLTHATIVAIRQTLEQQWAKLNFALEGNPHAAVPSEGSKKELLAMDEGWDNAVRGLSEGFGRIRQRDGREAKDSFFTKTWRPLYSLRVDHATQMVGRKAYRELIDETQRVERSLQELIDQVTRARRDLELAIATDLGESGASGVLDLSVMDDPNLVAYYFNDHLTTAKERGVETCAGSVTAYEVVPEEPTELISAEDQHPREHRGIILDAFNQNVASVSTYHEDVFRHQLEKAVVDDGIKRLAEQVRQLSIWDALVAEFHTRRSQKKLVDDAVAKAMSTVAAERLEVERAGPSDRDWDNLAIRYFIREKLKICQNRAQPFWQLNHLIAADYPDEPPAYQFFVIATDEVAYHQAEGTLGIHGVLEETATQLGAGQPGSLPGKDRIVIYSRSGGVPLFYLDDDELAEMRRATASMVQRGRFLFTDKRFAGNADDVIRPEEPQEDIQRFVIALSLQLGVARLKADGGFVITDPRWKGDRTEFVTVQHVTRAMDEDPELLRELSTLVDLEMKSINAAMRQQELQQTLERATKFWIEAIQSDAQPESRFWQAARRAVQTRLDYGRYFVHA